MRIIFFLLVIGLTTYAVIDCVRSEDSRRPVGPTWAWVMLILLLQPLVGALLWLFVSRFFAGDGNQPVIAERPIAPDDDPDFLRFLDERNLRDQHKKPGASGPSGSGHGGEEPRKGGTDGADRTDGTEDDRDSEFPA